jgi:hypothetical protein
VLNLKWQFKYALQLALLKPVNFFSICQSSY